MARENDPLVDPNTQIEALLTSSACALAEAVLGRVDSVEDYQRVFTVTESDVMRFIESHGLPDGACKTAPGAGETLYCHAEAGQWVVYRMERGRRRDSQGPFESRDEALMTVARLKLRYSGTGIDFAVPPGQTGRGNGGFPVVKFSPSENPDVETAQQKARNVFWPWRAAGLLICLASLAAMLFEIRYLHQSGVPEATGSRTGNLGALILLSLPWVALGLGVTVLFSNRPPRELMNWFNRQPLLRRVGWSIAVLVAMICATGMVLMAG